MGATSSRTAAYARISKDRPDIPKVADQLLDCAGLASREGYDVPVEYAEEPGTSATKGAARPGLDRLITDVLAGRFDRVLAVEQSRFNRSVMDNEKLMAACFATGTVIHTVRDGKTDPTNDADEFVSTMFAARDRLESRRISKRVRSANSHLVARGRPIVTKRPFGYEKDGVTQRPAEARALRSAIDHVLGGGSTWQVMKDLRAGGLTPVISRKELAAAEAEARPPRAARWSYGTLNSMLLRPGNYGLLLHRGEVVGEGDYKGIGTPEEYERMKALLKRPERSIAPDREPKHLMSGLLICGTCDGPMFRTTQRNRHKPDERLAVYRCQANDKSVGSVRHATVMQHIVDDMVRQSIAARFVMIENAAELGGSSSTEVAGLQRRLGELKEEKESLIAMFSTPNFRVHVQRRAVELSSEEDQVQARLRQIAGEEAQQGLAHTLKADFWRRMRDGQDSEDAALRDAGQTMERVVGAFDALPLAHRRAIVTSMVKVTIGRGQGPLRVKVEVLADATT